MSESIPTHQQLIEAICVDDLDTARKLVLEGADCEALGCIEQDRASGILKDLLSHVGGRCSWKYAAVHLAACRNEESLLRLMVEAGVNIRTVDLLGTTPLHWAAKAGSCASAQYLLEQGADVTQGDYFGYTALHAVRKSAALIELLLKHGAEVNRVGYHDESPLARAASNGNLDGVRALLAAGADPNLGHSPLQEACSIGSVAMVEALLQSGAEPNGSDEDTMRPIHLAAKDANILKLLIDRGADVNARDPVGHTALHIACIYDEYRGVDMLIAAGIDVNAADSEDETTALHIAAEWGNVDICKRLIEAGADPELPNGYGQLPVHLAECEAESKPEARLAVLRSILQPDSVAWAEAGRYVDRPPYLHPEIIRSLAKEGICSLELKDAKNGEACHGTVYIDGNRITSRTPDDPLYYEYMGRLDNGIELVRVVISAYGDSCLLLLQRSSHLLENLGVLRIMQSRGPSVRVAGNTFTLTALYGEEQVYEVDL